MRWRILTAIAATTVMSTMAMTAQENHDHHGHDDMTMETADTMKMDHTSMMSHGFSRSLPMNRNGSGTSWMPDASPMFGYMSHAGSWMIMAHGNIFGRYTAQDVTRTTSRGAAMFDAPNWAMVMAQTPVGSRGLFRTSIMASLDRLVMPGDGYPLLFQSGESWEGRPLVDRQHPHDVLAELSIAYTHMFSRDVDATIYLAYPGEPAIGPTAFMHRVSSMFTADAPLGHHWQDATHITYGVATAGLRTGPVKLEGSVFTGREPDEDRWVPDKPRFDSWSARLSWNPTSTLALQISHGLIMHPEVLKPEVNVRRTTASAMHTTRLAPSAWIASTFAWGYNDVDEHHREHSLLLESALLTSGTAISFRGEVVQKGADELVLPENMFGHDARFDIGNISLSVSRSLVTIGETVLWAGLQGAVGIVPRDLEPVYGRTPLSLQAFIRISPDMMSEGAD